MTILICFDGGVVGILPLCYGHSNPVGLSSTETVSDGQFDWGGRLLKGNGGATQIGRASCRERV